MPGDIGAVAALLTKVLGAVFDEDGLNQLTRENKLKLIMRGCNAAITNGDWASFDRLMDDYRELRQQT